MQELIYLSYSTEKLLEAVKNPYVKPDQIKSLVKNGADANARIDEEGYTILMTALYNVYNPEVIAELIKAGANVNARNLDYLFETVLLIAAMNNPNPLIFRELINAGADVNARDDVDFTVLAKKLHRSEKFDHSVSDVHISHMIAANFSNNTYWGGGITILLLNVNSSSLIFAL